MAPITRDIDWQLIEIKSDICHGPGERKFSKDGIGGLAPARSLAAGWLWQ
jgi:hypothetical protein